MIDDLIMLREAYGEAVKYSTDPSTQNGAVLVDYTHAVVARGANHFPVGVRETPERWERPAKYQYVEHAERNSIFDAARRGVGTNGLVMYCPWFACSDCARAIIQAGISEVVGHSTPIHGEGSATWKQSIEAAYRMFEESRVRFRHVEGTLGIVIRFNGKLVTV